MALSATKSLLENSIKQAFLNMKSSSEADGSNPNANINELASSLAAAIHDYVTSANVDITSVITTVPAGVLVATTGSPVSQAGTTVSPGLAQHAGFGKLL